MSTSMHIGITLLRMSVQENIGAILNLEIRLPAFSCHPLPCGLTYQNVKEISNI